MLCFHAGLALVAEGFLSAFYHVCPNDTNFQFGEFTILLCGNALFAVIVH